MKRIGSTPYFDMAETGAIPPLGDLPEWDLSDLYTAADAP